MLLETLQDFLKKNETVPRYINYGLFIITCITVWMGLRDQFSIAFSNETLVNKLFAMLHDPRVKCSLPFLTRDVVGPISAGKNTFLGHEQSHEILRET